MTLTTTLTDRASGFLERRTGRRGFLSRTAMVGSAMAVAGSHYVLRPGTAYAAVCSCVGRPCDCSNLCCDGYTEFCCQIYGENTCPPDTVLAGWWKVDNSDFCEGAARYYMDCNKRAPACSCGPSGVCRGGDTACQCRSCGHRKDGCTAFRYGNCNNQISCVGPIMCRVVTCTKPWELDPACSTVARTDNNTRSHHRPCLERDPSSGELAWVRAIFHDFLDRAPTREEELHHGRLLVQGRSRGSIADDFAESDAYIAVFLEGLYQSVFARSADEGGRASWTSAIRGGMKPAEVAARFYASDEFFIDAGSVDEFVERLYVEILHRPSDASGKQNWVAAVESGQPRVTVTRSFYGSHESRRTRVTSLYRHFLQRDPDPSGLESWTRELGDGDDLRLATMLAASTEYYRNALERFPEPGSDRA